MATRAVEEIGDATRVQAELTTELRARQMWRISNAGGTNPKWSPRAVARSCIRRSTAR